MTERGDWRDRGPTSETMRERVLLPTVPEPSEDVRRALRESGVLDSQEAWDAHLAATPCPVPMGEDVTRGLPADLASVLRDQSFVVPQDAAVFEFVAAWAKAPSATASAGNARELETETGDHQRSSTPARSGAHTASQRHARRGDPKYAPSPSDSPPL